MNDLLDNPEVKDEPPIYIDHLAREIASHQDVSISAAHQFVLAFIEIVADHLKHDRRVVLKGLGRLTVKQLAARERRNPKTGASIPSFPYRTIRFKTSEKLKRAMR